MRGTKTMQFMGSPEICLWLAVSAITHLGNTNGGSVEDGKLLVHAHACTCGDSEALAGVGEVTSDDHGDAGPDRESGEVAAWHGPHKAGEMEDA